MKLDCHISYPVNSHIFIVKRGRQLGKKTKNKKKKETRQKTKNRKRVISIMWDPLSN